MPEGEEGEVAAIGPSVHLSYAKNPTANAELFTGSGWFRTGDMGAFDARGNLQIVGRNKEMINRGGKKFHPREIEEILYTHPKVLHAAIVGIADPRLGERNCLYVIPRDGEAAALEDFVDLLRGRVATYKLPETVEIFNEFPFTPTGKIQRRELVRMVAARSSCPWKDRGKPGAVQGFPVPGLFNVDPSVEGLQGVGVRHSVGVKPIAPSPDAALSADCGRPCVTMPPSYCYNEHSRFGRPDGATQVHRITS